MQLGQNMDNSIDSIGLELNKELNSFKDELDNFDKLDYSFNQNGNTITLIPTNEDKVSIKITVENGILNFSHNTEGFLSEGDLEQLTEDEKSNNEELNKINQVLKTYGMPILKSDDSIYLLLIIDNLKNLYIKK